MTIGSLMIAIGGTIISCLIAATITFGTKAMVKIAARTAEKIKNMEEGNEE